MSNPSVFPSNWKNGGLSILDIDWRIQYYFYDPSHPRKKKLCVVKGMNSYKDLNERRDATKIILDDEIDKNKNGYNPILGKFVINEDFKNAELHPDLPFVTALEIARRKMHVSDSQQKQLKWVTERIRPTAVKMKISDVTIQDLTRRQLKNLLDRLDLPDEYYNRFKGYLGSIFRELVEYECCETNITRDIRKRKTIKREREILSHDHFQAVMKHLKANYYNFYRYAQIFSYSGGRSSELFSVQAKNVDLANQEYQVIIKKGRSYREQTKVILKAAMPFWEDLMKDAKPDDFIFSRNLEPGAKQIQSYQITKRWYRLVKNSDSIVDLEGSTLKITADFYSLKHSLLDSLPADIAQQMAAHTNASTTAIYQVNKEKRQRELLKELELN